MRKITAFLPLFLLLIGTVGATENTDSADLLTVTERKVYEITLEQAVLQKIRTQNKTALASDLSQLLKESSSKETDDTHLRDYDADVKKLFDSLY